MKRTVKTAWQTYKLAARTKDFIFYVNYEESDENASVLMYNHNGGLISNNYFAYVGLMDAVETGEITWSSKQFTQITKTINNEKGSILF